MRRLLGLLAALALLGTGAYAAQAFVEGKDYRQLSGQGAAGETPDQTEVVEFFWYGCPHCYDFEPYVNDWLESKPQAATFKRVPAVLRPSWAMQARTFYTLQLMDEIERLHMPIFQAIHEQGRRLDDLDSMLRFLTQQGVDEAEFRKVYDSLAVQTRMQQAARLARRYRVQGVPSVVVGGEYVSSASQAGSYERLVEVINFLVDKESG